MAILSLLSQYIDTDNFRFSIPILLFQKVKIRKLSLLFVRIGNIKIKIQKTDVILIDKKFG